MRGLGEEYPETNEGMTMNIGLYVREIIGYQIPQFLFTMLGAVALVLVIACANVANLLLARASLRSKEVAVCKRARCEPGTRVRSAADGSGDDCQPRSAGRYRARQTGDRPVQPCADGTTWEPTLLVRHQHRSRCAAVRRRFDRCRQPIVRAIAGRAGVGRRSERCAQRRHPRWIEPSHRQAQPSSLSWWRWRSAALCWWRPG